MEGLYVGLKLLVVGFSKFVTKYSDKSEYFVTKVSDRHKIFMTLLHKLGHISSQLSIWLYLHPSKLLLTQHKLGTLNPN